MSFKVPTDPLGRLLMVLIIAIVGNVVTAGIFMPVWTIFALSSLAALVVMFREARRAPVWAVIYGVMTVGFVYLSWVVWGMETAKVPS